MTPAPDTRDILARLGRLHARARARVGALGALQALAGSALVLAFAALAVGWPAVPHPVWTVLVLLGAGAAIVGLWAERVVLPWRDLGDRRRFTRDLDRAGGHRNLLVAAAEAVERPERWPDRGVGKVLADRLTREAGPRLDAADPRRDLGLPGIAKALGPTLAVAALILLPALLVPETADTGAARLRHPLHLERWTPSVGLYLEPGPDHVTAGDDVELTAVDFGTPRGPVVCEVREMHRGWRTLPASTDSLPFGGPPVRYRVRVEGLAEDMVYRFRRDGMTTVEAQVRVHHRPLFTALAVSVEPPAYTGLPVRDLDPWPARLEVPEGSTLAWRGTASHAVTAAGFVSGADTLAWTVDGVSVAGSAVIREDLTGTVALIDGRGLTNPDPVERRILARADNAPTVWMSRRGGDDGRLPPDGLIALDLLAEDDHGVEVLHVLLRRDAAGFADPDTSWLRLRIPEHSPSATLEVEGFTTSLAVTERDGSPGAPRVARALELDVSRVDLLPGEALELVVEVRDNRRPGPGARARSRTLRLVVPSATDLLAEQFETADERRDDLSDLRERGERMAEDLDRIERELKKNAELDFARRQELEDAVARQQGLQEELSDLGEQMREDLGRLAEHNLADPRLLEKMERVADLLEQVRTEEMERLQEQLREAMEQLSEQDIRDAMAEISEQQQDYLERLDRAIALLEDLRREQELAGMAAQLEEIMRDQEKLTAATEEAAAEAEQAEGEQGEGEEGEQSDGEQGDASEAARRQEELAAEMAALREQIEAARDRLAAEQEAGEESPAAEAMLEALEKALEQMKEQGPEQAMSEAAAQMKQDGPQSDPSESQHESMRKMASLYHVLLQGQQSMQMAMEEYVGDALRRLASDLLELSRRQELVATAIPADLLNVRAPALTRDQKKLLRGVVDIRDRLEEVLGKSPTLSYQLMQGLDGVIGHLETSLGHLGANWAVPASAAARDGLGSMNRMVMNLLTSAQSQGGGGGGGSPMPSLGQQLEQMAREQAGLNGLADQLHRQMREQGPSQEARARMERLQADQQGMAGRLNEADQEARDTPEAQRLLGDLQELARDMERVSDSLASGDIDEDVLRRQERILGRLLDARNSVRRRDYDKRRESQTADGVLRAQLGDDLGDTDAADRERLQRRREQAEHVPPDYRDLVRRYFRSLGSEENGAGEVRR